MARYPKRYGLLRPEELNPKDWRLGGPSGATRSILKASGSYLDVLPDTEYQKGVYFDTMGCVSFSALNCLEIIANVNGMKWNKSDRFTSKISGTTKKGNYLVNVAESIRTHGTVIEENWTWSPKQKQPVYEWDDFYAPIPESIKMEGKRWLNDWEVQWEWIPLDRIKEALTYGPLQVTVKAWPRPNSNGLYTDGGDQNRNHAVTLVEATNKHYTIFDHYDNVIKKLVPNYDFKWAMQFHLIKKDNDKPMPIIDLTNDVLVQEVEQTGAFGLHLNGKIIIDDVALLQATWLMRNSGDIKGKVKTLTKEQWDSFPKQNLKGNDII